MKRSLWIGLLVLLAFAAILLVRLPASWFAGVLPSQVSCLQLSGTIWNGSCGGLTSQDRTYGDLKWQLHPLALLGGKLAADVDIAGPIGSATAQLEARSGNRLTARGLRADFALDPALAPQMPRDLRGRVQTDLALLRVEKGIITALEGRLDARDLERRGVQRQLLGDYVVTFPEGGETGGEPVGQVRSTKGPLQVEAKLRLTRAPGVVLEGTIAPGPGTPPELLQELSYLGTPDARGRRPFSVENNF